MIVQETTIVEGFGDEVILSVTSVMVMVVTLVALIWVTRRRGGAEIHPDHIGIVHEARQHLGVDMAGENGDGQQQRQGARAYRDDGEPCPICINTPSYAVSTNCRHFFCAACVLEFYRRHVNFPRAVHCPVCRQVVTILLTDFTLEEVGDGEQLVAIQARIHEYNRRCSGAPRTVMEYVRDMPALLQYLWRQLLTPNGLPIVFRLRVCLAIVFFVIYVILPVDLLPEAVLGMLGLVDDLLAFYLLFIYLTVIIRNVVVQRAEQDA